MHRRKHQRSSSENHRKDGSGMDEPMDIRGDEKNIFILLVLYLLQGIPLGLSNAIPMILQNRGVSFKQQAEFSFVYWPFSLKLLWAPLVDSLFLKSFGRRKTWMVPAQYLIGTFMIFLSSYVETWLGDANTEPQIGVLTALFFTLNFLAATQDIAVDGWALTMLRRRNVGYASTCNSVGQTAGYFLGYVVFIALESPVFCNNYLRSVPQPEGIVTLTGFLYFWGIVYVVVTTLVAIFKHEDPERSSVHSAVDSYLQLGKILKLSCIKKFVFFLLTVKIGFAACDAVTHLKLVQGGVPKEKLAILAVPLVPLQIILPVIISRYHIGRKPMDLYIKVVPYRLSFNILAALLVYTTPWFLMDNQIPVSYYLVLLSFLALHQICLYCMFVQSMAFFARVSDPKVGGTYMTLLNTVSNLGGTWTSTVALWLTDYLTWKSCTSIDDNDCSTPLMADMCIQTKGTCSTLFDGYYLELVLCTIIGALWYKWGRRAINDLQNRPSEAWSVSSSHREWLLA